MQQPFLYYKDKVKYDYILQASVKVECNSDIVREIINLFSNEDFLAMYFENVGLGCVYTQVEYFHNKLRIVFGISNNDYKQPFDEKYLEKCIKNLILSLNKNIDGMQKVDEEEIKVENLLTSSIDLENIDKKLVSENTIRFCCGDNTSHFSLTDDGIIEIYHNYKLENMFPFSKKGLIRECKTLLENDYTLSDNIIDNNDAASMKNDLKQKIDAIDELQDLQDELQDKVSTLMGESLEQSDEYALVVFKKSGNKFNPSAVIQNISIDGYYTAKSMDDVGIYKKDEADRYVEIFNRYKKKDNIELQAVSKNEIQDMKIVTESIDLELYDEFPSSELTDAPINMETLQHMNLDNDLTTDQCMWVTIHLGSVADLYSALCDLFSECDSDIEISIDDYIANLKDGGVIETWKTKI